MNAKQPLDVGEIAAMLNTALANGTDYSHVDPEVVATNMSESCPAFEGEEIQDLLPGIKEWQAHRLVILQNL